MSLICLVFCQVKKKKLPLIHGCIVDGRRGDGSESLMQHWHVVTATLTHRRAREWGLTAFLTRCESEPRGQNLVESWEITWSRPRRDQPRLSASHQSEVSSPASAALMPFTCEGGGRVFWWRLWFALTELMQSREQRGLKK